VRAVNKGAESVVDAIEVVIASQLEMHISSLLLKGKIAPAPTICSFKYHIVNFVEHKQSYKQSSFLGLSKKVDFGGRKVDKKDTL